jgi:hypothetical protein
MVDCLTDNKTRTVADVRHAFNKYGGNMGTDGCVAFQFKHCGQLLFAPGTSEDALMEAALEAGADDVATNDDGSIEVTTDPYQFGEVKEALEKAGFTAEFGEVTMKPLNETELAGDDARACRSCSTPRVPGRRAGGVHLCRDGRGMISEGVNKSAARSDFAPAMLTVPLYGCASRGELEPLATISTPSPATVQASRTMATDEVAIFSGCRPGAPAGSAETGQQSHHPQSDECHGGGFRYRIGRVVIDHGGTTTGLGDQTEADGGVAPVQPLLVGVLAIQGEAAAATGRTGWSPGCPVPGTGC